MLKCEQVYFKFIEHSLNNNYHNLYGTVTMYGILRDDAEFGCIYFNLMNLGMVPKWYHLIDLLNLGMV